MSPLVLVVAIAKNGVIGNKGALPWHYPEDLRHFKAMTVGHAILMGRKTHESIGRALPGRRNIVISSREGAHFEGCESATSLEQAISLARQTDAEPRVIGGSALYTAALPLATRIYLTEIDRDVEGDTTLVLDKSELREVDRRRGEDPAVSFVTLDRLS